MALFKRSPIRKHTQGHVTFSLPSPSPPSSPGTTANCSNFSESSQDTGHEDMIHDARLDFFGTTMATASADQTIRIFSLIVNPDRERCRYSLIQKLEGHTGPVWQVAWAHPKFGNILASCSYDRKVIIWQQNEIFESGKNAGLLYGTSKMDRPICKQKWEKRYVYEEHGSSVNAVEWAPPEHGLILACASSDSSISILSLAEGGSLVVARISNAHLLGCTSISWCPSDLNNKLPNSRSFYQRFVTGGNDNMVKIWREENGSWIAEAALNGHSDWVICVAWSPNVVKIASASADHRVRIWNYTNNNTWLPETLHIFEDVLWTLSWSLSGEMIAVTEGQNTITLWKNGVA